MARQVEILGNVCWKKLCRGEQKPMVVSNEVNDHRIQQVPQVFFPLGPKSRDLLDEQHSDDKCVCMRAFACDCVCVVCASVWECVSPTSCVIYHNHWMRRASELWHNQCTMTMHNNAVHSFVINHACAG